MRHFARPHIARLLALGGAAALLVACSATDDTSSTADSPTPSLSHRQHHTGPGGRSDHVDKLATFVVENKTFDQMRAQMPWVTRVAHRYGYATSYDALTHPSLPNYLAIAGGSLFGITDDDSPAVHPLTGPSVFGSALKARSTATLYAEGMNGNCELVPHGRYAVKHNPWAYFRTEGRACAQHDVPLTQLSDDIRAADLPAVGMVIPDLCNDAHDCSLSVADTWLHRVVGQMMNGPDWKAGHLAIVITADEDDRSDGNHVLTVVAQPSLHHVVVRTPMTHYSLGRAYAEVGGFAPVGNARTATSLLTSFGLTA
jgi:acid phosphatase